MIIQIISLLKQAETKTVHIPRHYDFRHNWFLCLDQRLQYFQIKLWCIILHLLVNKINKVFQKNKDTDYGRIVARKENIAVTTVYDLMGSNSGQNQKIRETTNPKMHTKSTDY